MITRFAVTFLVIAELFSSFAVFAKEDVKASVKSKDKSADLKMHDDFFSQSIDKEALEVKPTATIDLKNGDEFVLRASIVKEKIGKTYVKRLAYNGMIPGPMLRVKQGSEIKVKLINDTDVDTSLHSHGLRLDSKNDGIPGISQPPILPGQSFTYTLSFPDSGFFWYHPHIREDYAQELGLYGTFRVLPADSTYHNEAKREVPLILDDINLASDGQMPKFFKDRTNYALMGRFGNVLLVNNEKMFTVNVEKSEVIRFLVINVANTRTFRLSMPGVMIKRVAGDLSLYEKEEFVDEVILSPSERVLIEIAFDIKGNYKLFQRGAGQAVPIAEVNVSDPNPNMEFQRVVPFDKLHENPLVVSQMLAVRKLISKKPDRSISLRVALSEQLKKSMHGMNHHSSSSIEWEDPMESMNFSSSSKDLSWEIFEKSTGKKNMEINWKFKLGKLEKIQISNEAHSDHPMQHPIHFHGQRFAVLSENGVINKNMVWKDSVMVPAGETLEIVLDPSNPGRWMAHCHIAEHLHSGMMIGFQVD